MPVSSNDITQWSKLRAIQDAALNLIKQYNAFLPVTGVAGDKRNLAISLAMQSLSNAHYALGSVVMPQFISSDAADPLNPPPVISPPTGGGSNEPDPDPPPPPPPATGDGIFTVSGSDIIDPDGNVWIPRGVNGCHFWGNNFLGTYTGNLYAMHLATIPKVAAMGANTLRIVTQTQGAFGINATASQQRQLVEACITNGIVPMLEMHDATGSASAAAVLPYWLSTPMVQLAIDHPSMMVNIMNEHDFTASSSGSTVADPVAWRDYYIDAVQQLRAAGYLNLIVIDGGFRFAQDPAAIITYGAAVQAADPLGRCVFSAHLYSFWDDTSPAGWQFNPTTKLTELAGLNVPIIVGEIGWGPTTVSDCPYDTANLISIMDGLDIGHYFWEVFDPKGGAVEGSTPANAAGDGWRFCLSSDLHLDAPKYTPAGTFYSTYWPANAEAAVGLR